MKDFADRSEAGRRLASRLKDMALRQPIVLALPRGGIPVGIEVAQALRAPIDILFVRKIGLPSHPELAVAAVVDGADPQVVRNEELVRRVSLDEAYLERQRIRELAVIERRRELYCRGRPAADLTDRTVLVVDDGVATGTTVRAALAALRRTGAARLILATPVIAPDTAGEFRADGIEVVSVIEPEDFGAVGLFYQDFHQLTDGEVLALLEQAEPVA